MLQDLFSLLPLQDAMSALRPASSVRIPTTAGDFANELMAQTAVGAELPPPAPASTAAEPIALLQPMDSEGSLEFHEQTEPSGNVVPATGKILPHDALEAQEQSSVHQAYLPVREAEVAPDASSQWSLQVSRTGQSASTSVIGEPPQSIVQAEALPADTVSSISTAPSAGTAPPVNTEPSAKQEPSAKPEPSAKQELSAKPEPSPKREPSAKFEPTRQSAGQRDTRPIELPVPVRPMQVSNPSEPSPAPEMTVTGNAVRRVVEQAVQSTPTSISGPPSQDHGADKRVQPVSPGQQINAHQAGADTVKSPERTAGWEARVSVEITRAQAPVTPAPMPRSEGEVQRSQQLPRTPWAAVPPVQNVATPAPVIRGDEPVAQSSRAQMRMIAQSEISQPQPPVVRVVTEPSLEPAVVYSRPQMPMSPGRVEVRRESVSVTTSTGSVMASAQEAVSASPPASGTPVTPAPVFNALPVSTGHMPQTGDGLSANGAQQSTASQLLSGQTHDGATDLRESVREQIMGALSRRALREGKISLQLTPRELGTVELDVAVDGSDTRISIHTREATTRDLLESSVVRLRQALQEQGLQVGQLEVRLGQREQQDGRRQAAPQYLMRQESASAPGSESATDIPLAELSARAASMGQFYAAV